MSRDSEATRSRARVFGFFFNDGSSPVPGDFTGDVLAGIDIRRSSKTGDQIVAFVNRCDTPQCIFSATLSSRVFTRTWTPGTAQVVTVRWQAAANRFVFTVSGGSVAAETRALTYTQTDTAPPRSFQKEIRVQNSVPNCTAGRRVAVMDALFDNVAIDASAVPAPSALSDAEVEAEDAD